MSRDILVDGYNVIKNNPMFQSLGIDNMEHARRILLQQLRNRYRNSEHTLIVVFDGNGAREETRHEEHIRIVFSRYGEKADAVIIRMAAQAREAGREVEMYSDDGEIRDAVGEKGGQTRSTGHLAMQLKAGPRDVEARARHRIEVRKVYGLNPADKAKWDYEEMSLQQHAGGKKKKKKRK